MKRVLLICLLLQAVYAAKNITLSINVPHESPADVSYVEGKAPEELKAGPVKNVTSSKETISHAAFIRSSNREIPKDDEIENEEFERFIQKYHSRPTIETVFVSTSAPPPAEDSEELNEETVTSEPQAEVFKRPAQLRTYERNVAHPTLTSHILPPPESHPTYAIQAYDGSLQHAGSAPFGGGDGYIVQSHGGGAGGGNEGFIIQSNGGDGQYSTFNGGQFLLTDSQGGSGGEQQYYQFANYVPTTFNVAQNAVKTKTYEIRRPAIQKHYYDIEERVIIRPAGSIVVELDRPVAKVPTGETVVAVGGLHGTYGGGNFQQSSQGGLNFFKTFGVNGGGVGIQQSQGGLSGSGITYTSSIGAPSFSGSVDSGSGTTFTSSIGAPSFSGSVGSGSGTTFASSVGLPSFSGPVNSGSGITYTSSTSGVQGSIGGTQGGIGIQQSQGGITFSTTTQSPNASPTSSVVINTQQSQGGSSGSGTTFTSSIGAPSFSGSFGSGSGTTFASSVGLPSFSGPVNSGSGITYTSSTSGVQGSIGGTQGGIGVQQSQGGITFSTTTQSPNASPTSNVFINTQQSQGSVGVSQNGVSTSGIQQSQGGVVVTTTPAPSVTQTSSTTANTLFAGSNSGFTGVGVQQSQGGISGGVFQQSQGGAVYSTTGVPFFQSNTPLPNSGGSFGAGFQSQGGAVYSTTGVPIFQSSTPALNGGGVTGIGFQQSQGGIGISQGGGTVGAGFQQSQGGVFSTTPAPYLPPAAPTPTVLIGGSNRGSSGAGFQQSQGGIGLTQGGTQGGFGFQQSQGGIGLSQGGGFAGFQQSQGGIGVSQGGSYNGGEIIYSTTASPSISFGGSRPILLRPNQAGGGYQSVSTTTGSPFFISTPFRQGSNGNSFVVQASSNAQSKGSVSSTTTTERSFSVSQDASAFARGSSSGSVQSVSKNITPYMIAVGEPDFSYPPYVEITSNGSPLGHLKQQPYARVQAQNYPRMRYQGKLLTGEVQIDDGLAHQQDSQQQGYGALSSHHQNYESPAHVAEISTDSPQEDQSAPTGHQLGLSHNHQPDNSNTQYQHQFVGSSQQPVQTSQISSSAHQQPDQVYQQHFLRAISQPILITTQNAEQHAAQQHAAQQHVPQQYAAQQHAAQQHVPQQHAAQQHAPQQYTVQQQAPLQSSDQQQFTQQYYVQEQQHPIQPENYQSQIQQHHHISQPPQEFFQAPNHQQQTAQVRNPKPVHHNLVAQIRHQQLAPQQQAQVEAHRQQTHHEPTESTNLKQQKDTEALETPVEVSEVYSSTHQQPTLYQQQVATTTHTLEPYNSGQRQYKQRGAPLKYTQDQSLNIAPSEHTVYFNNNLEHTSARSQNLEIPSEHGSLVKETTGKSIESSTIETATPSTTTSQRLEEPTHPQRKTYASVLAQGKPGILYAPPKPAGSQHSPGHRQHFLPFNSDGASLLFSPSGRQLHLVYSHPPRRAYSHQPHTHSVPVAPIEPARQQISVSNKGVQIEAELPITRQSQVELSASSSKPAYASDPQITRSQSHAESHQTSARYEGISSTTPETAPTKEEHHKVRGPQKYRNEQTHGALTLRSGRTYGDHRVIASTPAPSDGGAASESVQTRRIVVNHPFQTVQEVVEREPVTNIHQVTLNASAKQVYHGYGLQQGQQKAAALRTPVPYGVVASLNHPEAALSFRHGGSH